MRLKCDSFALHCIDSILASCNINRTFLKILNNTFLKIKKNLKQFRLNFKTCTEKTKVLSECTTT